jgi:glucokinase
MDDKDWDVFDPATPVGVAGDIGGTNARFCLAGRNRSGRIITSHRRALRADDYPDLEACLRAYLGELSGGPTPSLGGFGVACAVAGDELKLTNRNWRFSISGLQAHMGWRALKVVNDFVVLAYAIPALHRDDYTPLPGPDWPETPPHITTLIGPGTGLGVGAAVLREGRLDVLPSEGGHASFAAHDLFEVELTRVLLSHFPRISFERLISGPGMDNLYRAVGTVMGKPAPLVGAPAITAAGLNGSDAVADETLNRFCLIFATAASNAALIQGAGAVAIAGGILPHMIDRLRAPAVRARFEDKGRARAVMEAIPWALIAHPDPALLGAARLMFH